MSDKTHLVSRCDAITHFEMIASIFANTDDALVFTDPPFFTGKQFWWDTQRVGIPTLAYHDYQLSHEKQVEFHRSWIEGYVKSRKSVRFAIFGDMLSEVALRYTFSLLGIPLRAEIILREQGQGTIRREYRKGFFFEHVKLMIFTAAPLSPPKVIPAEFFAAIDARSVWTNANSRSFDSGYPTEKSLEIASAVVRWLAPDEGTLVIDPFAGSGSLIRAARRLGHSTIGLDESQAAIDYILLNP
jgi:hypothetical protein